MKNRTHAMVERIGRSGRERRREQERLEKKERNRQPQYVPFAVRYLSTQDRENIIERLK